MSFGKKASINNTPKKKLDVNKDVKSEELVDECNNDNTIHINRNNNDIINANTRSNKVNKTDFLKHIKKNKKSSDILLFGLSKEEKLELFINNLKLLHSGIPDFWFNKEVSEFKKKFNM